VSAPGLYLAQLGARISKQPFKGRGTLPVEERYQQVGGAGGGGWLEEGPGGALHATATAAAAPAPYHRGVNAQQQPATRNPPQPPLQIGNAVAPPMAKALGRCLLLALEGKSPPGAAVVAAPDPELAQVRAGRPAAAAAGRPAAAA
jgi:hypothetical protein